MSDTRLRPEYTDEDMAAVGRSLMESLHSNCPKWMCADSPAEIVVDLLNQIHDMKTALEFYADPFEWKKKNDPDDCVRVPDFYSETSFGDTALVALANQPFVSEGK